MNPDEFWNIIDAHMVYKANGDPDVEPFTAALAKLAPAKIAAFDVVFTDLHSKAYAVPLWGAAYVINAGCSDDGFTDFRSWLIAKGRAVFEAAVAEPDSLADVDVEEGHANCEEMAYAASEAYLLATEGDLDPAPGEEPALGESWDFDDPEEMAKRYPRLCAKCGWV